MVQSKRTIPHYTYVDECDVSELVRLRDGLREEAAKVGVKITYLPFFVKAVADALKKVPIVNASLDEHGWRDRLARPLPHRRRRGRACRADRARGA